VALTSAALLEAHPPNHAATATSRMISKKIFCRVVNSLIIFINSPGGFREAALGFKRNSYDKRFCSS
jgi:hypothetical protein